MSRCRCCSGDRSGGGRRGGRRYRKRSRVHKIAAIRQRVDFGERDTSTTVLTAYDYRVSAGIKRKKNRGFEVVGRRDPGRFDFGLLGVLPVVICCDERPVAVVKFERWIG